MMTLFANFPVFITFEAKNVILRSTIEAVDIKLLKPKEVLPNFFRRYQINFPFNGHEEM